MTLVQIVFLAVLAGVLGRLRAGRQLAMLVASAGVLFWLQPAGPVASLGYWLPLATIALTVFGWTVTAHEEARSWRANWPAAAALLSVVLFVGLWPPLASGLNTTLIAPPFSRLAPAILTILAAGALLWRWRSATPLLGLAMAFVVLLIFVFIKSPTLQATTREWLSRTSVHEDGPVGAPLAWLGYSYVAFRLLHTLRDRHTGKLPTLTLGEYVNYVIFFPAYTAGPIDRVERFVAELREPLGLTNADWVQAGTRLTVGLFKKIVLADLLAVIAFNDVLVQYARSTGWMWVFLYAYALRIFLDFSGYTDIALAMGRLLGVRLPENFNRPYLKQNIALFWNAWHMSLTQWFRAYVFNPIARSLRSLPAPIPAWVVLLIAQLVTMVLIGLWHGITLTFALWGLWHGLGLFVHDRWAQFAKSHWTGFAPSPAMGRALNVAGTVLTFHFVSLGWLFFGLSTPQLAWRAFRLLFGLA